MLLAGCAKSTSEKACEALSARTWSLDQIPAYSGTCPAPQKMRDLSTSTKLAVAVYHFNIQYVAGGLTGFPDNTITPKYDLNEQAVEDSIVRQGFEPLLDLYLMHPSFHADIELQSYMLEVIAKRHPDVLDKMRMLAASGQIDFDSFHYSDQLFLAFPKRDLEVGIDFTDQIFARVCLPKGRSIFTQEGQFARGELPIARDHGYAVAVLPKNLFSYQLGQDAANRSVLFEDPETPGEPVLIGGQSWTSTAARPGQTIELVWTYMNDGEIALSKGGLDPYFGTDYVVDPAAVASKVMELEALEQNGFVHATIAEAVAAMTKMGIPHAKLPPVFDGTWQPSNTNNMYRWMGGGGLFHTYERDSDTLAAEWRASAAVKAAEAAAGASPKPEIAAALSEAWREALLSQDSDSTGWNPWRTEVEYSNRHAAYAIATATNALACMGATAPSGLACGQASTAMLPDLGVETRSPARQITTAIHDCPSAAGETIREITVLVPKVVDAEQLVDQTDQEANERQIEMRFTVTSTDVMTTLALDDSLRDFRRSDYAFDSMGVVIPIGLVRLGDKRWLIQDLTTGRLAAILSRTGADMNVISFLDTTVSRAHASTRRWYVVDGADATRALSLAHEVNRQ
jgi:hypothetical protein